MDLSYCIVIGRENESMKRGRVKEVQRVSSSYMQRYFPLLPVHCLSQSHCSIWIHRISWLHTSWTYVRCEIVLTLWNPKLIITVTVNNWTRLSSTMTNGVHTPVVYVYTISHDCDDPSTFPKHKERQSSDRRYFPISVMNWKSWIINILFGRVAKQTQKRHLLRIYRRRQWWLNQPTCCFLISSDCDLCLSYNKRGVTHIYTHTVGRFLDHRGGNCKIFLWAEKISLSSSQTPGEKMTEEEDYYYYYFEIIKNGGVVVDLSDCRIGNVAAKGIAKALMEPNNNNRKVRSLILSQNRIQFSGCPGYCEGSN